MPILIQNREVGPWPMNTYVVVCKETQTSAIIDPGAEPKRILDLVASSKVKAILINIFGGIVRCDRVAQGVVDAYKNMGEIPVPIIVRLQGTNAEEAKKLIDDAGLNVHSAVLLQEAADKVKEVLA